MYLCNDISDYDMVNCNLSCANMEFDIADHVSPAIWNKWSAQNVAFSKSLSIKFIFPNPCAMNLEMVCET